MKSRNSSPAAAAAPHHHHQWTRSRHSDGVFGVPGGNNTYSGVRSTFDGGIVGSEVYYIGIIDILQQYNFRKIGEHAYKSLLRPSRAHHISAVTPSEYAMRFVRFLEGVTK